MKSLLDIQQELRDLETDVKSITSCIENIHADISEMRDAAQDAQGREFDYARIETLAKKIPFNNHPIGLLKDARMCQLYLEMLLNIVRMDYDSETTANRLVFIQWIQSWAETDWSLEELFADSCSMQKELYDEFAKGLSEDYIEYFCLDALIIANIGGEANREILEYLAEMSSIFGITTERMRELAVLTMAALCREFKEMEIEEADQILDEIERFAYYIDEDMVQKTIEPYRKIVEKCSDDVFMEWTVKQKQEVEKGECIARHKRGSSILAGSKNIYSPLAGTIYQFKIKSIYYGVVSLKSDN